MFVLAACGEGYIYGYHNKIYTTKGLAEYALKTLTANHKLSDTYRVFEISGLTDIK